MKQLLINIQEGKYAFFLELIKSLDFAHVEEDTGDSEAVRANLKQAFKDLRKYKQGKLNTTSAEDFLNEL